MKISLLSCMPLALLAAAAVVAPVATMGETAARIRPTQKKSSVVRPVPAKLAAAAKKAPGAIAAAVTSNKESSSNVIVISNKSTLVHLAVVCAMNSGFINGCFLSGLLTPTKQGVAAVTGAWTNSAIGAANGNFPAFYGQAAIIASFLTGSLMYGFLCPKPKPFELPKEKVSSALFLTAACLIGADVILRLCGSSSGGGKSFAFGEQLAAMCLASVACGIQNSLTSSHSANLCRTTHFTGISSDMGTFLGQCLAGNTENIFRLQSFAKLAAGFWTGGLVAVKACTVLGGGGPATPMRVAAMIQTLMGVVVLMAK